MFALNPFVSQITSEQNENKLILQNYKIFMCKINRIAYHHANSAFPYSKG